MEPIEPIDIVITSFKRPKMTIETIRYIKERTKYPYRLFLIDNDGNEEAKIEYVNDFFLIIDPNYNVGIHCAWNIALAITASKYFITTDNDILVPDLRHKVFDTFKNWPDKKLAYQREFPDKQFKDDDEISFNTPDQEQPCWLERLVKLMDARPDFGAIALQPHKFIGLEPSVYPDDGEIINTPMVGAVMRLMRRDAVWKAGGWERIVRQSRNHEEKVICSRLATAGYKFGYASKLKAFHMFGTEGETDYWGYEKDAKPEDHGHRDIWPPLWVYGNREEYDEKTWEKLL